MKTEELLQLITDFLDDPRIKQEVQNDYSDRLENIILNTRNTSELEQLVIMNELDNWDVMQYE